MAIIFCVIFCFTAQAQAQAPTNLMTNPGFESDFQGWIDWGNSFIDTATVHSGAKAARIGPAAGGRAQRFYDLVADTQYTMCAWSKLDSLSTPASIGVDIYDATATRIGNHQWTVAWTTWTEESVTFFYPSNADFLNVWVWVSASSDPAYVDDFSLVEGASCEGQSESFLTEPYLQSVRADGITIMWELPAAASCPVEYGLDDSYGSTIGASHSASTSGGTEIYKSTITGLSAGTTYHYRVNVGGAPGIDRRFRTAPAGEADFSFAQWGDSQGTSNATIPMMQHLAASGVDIAIATGDMAEHGGSYSSIRNFFLDRVVNNVAQTIPLDIAWGDHDDYGSAEIKDFTDFGPGSYSFDYANVHFTLIDWIDDDNWGWIEADLAAAQSARHRFVFIHDPPYSERWIDGDSDLRANLVPLLEQYNVDICFSGHTHAYLRGEQNGVTYVVSGGGSWLDAHEPLVYDWPHMTVGGHADTWGAYGVEGGLVNEYVKVDVTSTGWTATMYGFNTDGTIKTGVVDVFSKNTATPEIEVMSWVPPYAIPNSQAAVEADFGPCDAKDGLTRVGLQFWTPNPDGTIKYADHESYTPTDADVAWWTNWGQANGIEVLLTIYNNTGSSDWDLARSAFADNRAAFVNALVSEMDRLNLDGVDIDLEGFGNHEADRSAFDLFVHHLSLELNARGKILTIDSFHFIWNAPNHNWWSDWVGEVDNIHSMGYHDLYEGGTTWHKYSYQQAAGTVAGYEGDSVLMGMPSWLASWGVSSGRGLSAQAHVQEVRYDLVQYTGIAIWDLQLREWQDSNLWCEIRNLKILGGVPTLVEAGSFAAAPQLSHIVISWHTVLETELAGFNIYRAETAEGPWEKLNAEMIESKVPGSPYGASYVWEDWTERPCAMYFYVLEAVYTGGTGAESDPISATAGCLHRVHLPAVLR